MALLANPEAAWSRAVLPTVDRAEVERRLGLTDEPIEVLSGGFANLNVRVGRDRVLRITDRATLAKQVALLSRPWRALRTPRVLATGDDFLVLEHLPLTALATWLIRQGSAGSSRPAVHLVEPSEDRGSGSRVPRLRGRDPLCGGQG